MACPNCGTGVVVGTRCPACGHAAPAPAADQFGTPMPSGLTGYTPPPTTAQLYPAPAPATSSIAPPPPGEAQDFRQPAQVGNAFSIAGIVLGLVALLFCPIVFGLAAVALAQRAHKRGEGLWKTSLGIAIGGLVGGLIITRILMSVTSLYDVS